EVAREGRAVAVQLLDKFPVHGERLEPAVFAIGDVDDPVVGNAYGVHDVELVGPLAVREFLARAYRAAVVVGRLVGESAPHPLELARVRVENGYAAVAVAV